MVDPCAPRWTHMYASSPDTPRYLFPDRDIMPPPTSPIRKQAGTVVTSRASFQ
ncbi:hypothetical protein C8Q76DRAFT_721652 [Earliella scabrosa]|nr:hypothetical protein C8Q76DRAFT_721652 [Earliella scabrosa]